MRNLSLKLTKALFGAFLLTGYGLAYAKAASFNAPLTTAHCLFIEQLELADLEGRKLPEFNWLREKLVAPLPDAIDGACLGANDKDVLLSRAQQILIEKGFVTTRVLINTSTKKNDPLVLTIVPGRVRTIRFDNSGKVKTDLRWAFPMQAGELLNVRDIEQALENLKRIHINGGGFINASKATLTTGTPTLNQSQIDKYRVLGGSIAIDGAGLDLQTTDYAAILARAVQVNAGIWANDLKVITGTNSVDASSLSTNIAPLVGSLVGSGPIPEMALDVAQLGGMYAGKIFLLGTEAGLGVRSHGLIGSSDGNLVLQNNGPLTNFGTMQSKGDSLINTQSNLTNSGTLYATGVQSITTPAHLQNNGSVVSEGNTVISANSLSSSPNSSILAQGDLDSGRPSLSFCFISTGVPVK